MSRIPTPPWTTGPWQIIASETAWAGWAQIGTVRADGTPHVVAKVDGYGQHPEADANAALVLLAPQMAGVLLALDEQHSLSHMKSDSLGGMDDECVADCIACGVERVAAQLRAIKDNPSAIHQEVRDA